MNKSLGLCVYLNGNHSPLVFFMSANEVVSTIISFSQAKMPADGFIGGSTLDGVTWGVAVREIAALFSIDPAKQQGAIAAPNAGSQGRFASGL